MTALRAIALIGFGEVGETLARDFVSQDVALTAFDVLFPDGGSKPARAIAGTRVRGAASAADAARDADLVISAVTAARDVEAATMAAPGLKPGAFFLDVNSASPGMKQRSAAIVDGAGARYVEAAVMTPIHPHGVASSMLLGGRHAEAFITAARSLGFKGEVFSDEIGKASATKMCRSVIIKGVEALLSESMLAARHYGIEKDVLASLSDLLPLPDWDRTARYMISRALEHGVRRAEEMREAAETVAEAGIAPLMARATAERQDWSAHHKDALEKMGDLGAMLDAIRKDIDTPGRGHAA
jgi:3-hydroxyisobutyrate dehydrogenase-like beta-hydroxyacid dehydrogenase